MAAVNYSIRRVAVEGKKTEATGIRVHWLNTGDPIAFGFRTPAHMVAAVEKSRGNIASAARQLGINRSTLYYRLRKHGLEHLLPTKPAGPQENG